MMKVRNIVKAIVWLAALGAAWYFAGDYFAPDACLDSGGSFDYARWICSYTEDHPYVDIPVYALPSFWGLVGSLIVAASTHALLRKSRKHG